MGSIIKAGWKTLKETEYTSSCKISYKFVKVFYFVKTIPKDQKSSPSESWGFFLEKNSPKHLEPIFFLQEALGKCFGALFFLQEALGKVLELYFFTKGSRESFGALFSLQEALGKVL
jgi:hypothetical protein